MAHEPTCFGAENSWECGARLPCSAGESSGVAYRALGFGKILIVPEYMAFSNIDENLCEKIYYDNDDVVHQIYKIIKKYTKDRKLLKNKKDKILKSSLKKYGLTKSRQMYEEVFSLEL